MEHHRPISSSQQGNISPPPLLVVSFVDKLVTACKMTLSTEKCNLHPPQRDSQYQSTITSTFVPTNPAQGVLEHDIDRQIKVIASRTHNIPVQWRQNQNQKRPHTRLLISAVTYIKHSLLPHQTRSPRGQKSLFIANRDCFLYITSPLLFPLNPHSHSILQEGGDEAQSRQVRKVMFRPPKQVVRHVLRVRNHFLH